MKEKMLLASILSTIMLVTISFASAVENTNGLINEENNSNNYILNNKPSNALRNYFRFMFFNNQIRTYLIHLPPNYDGINSLPLVILLHGAGSNAKFSEKATGMSDEADKEGFIVVYANALQLMRFWFTNILFPPIGIWGNTWNGGSCCGFGLRRNVDDVGFIRVLIERLQNTYKIDPNRIYVTGGSNGGCLAYRIGSELSDIIAAIAPVDGTAGGNGTALISSPFWVIPKPKNPVSVIVFHGMNDNIFPYDGGPSTFWPDGHVWFLSVNDSVSIWVENNSCNSIPQIDVSDDGNIIIRTYTDGDNGTDVVLYTIVDGEHGWPRPNDMGISATDIIWDFFKSHPKQ